VLVKFIRPKECVKDDPAQKCFLKINCVLLKQLGRPGLVLFNLALDADSGTDPNRGSAISRGSAFFVNQWRLTFYALTSKDFISLNPDFGLVVVFLDCPLHRGHRAFSKMRWLDDCGSVREGPDPSTGLGSGHSAGFFPCAKENIKSGCVPCGAECGSGCSCRVHSPVLYRFCSFLTVPGRRWTFGSGPSGLDPHLIF
jgi:hypothetical protein